MSDGPRIGVLLGAHVLERFAERFPDEGRDATTVIFGEVMEALRQGRKAKRLPPWARYSARQRGDQSTRFVWNAAQTRCYVVLRVGRRQLQAAGGFERADEFDQTWTVKTVIARTDTQYQPGDLGMIRSFHGLERKLREKRKSPGHAARRGRGDDDEDS